ncbi:MAG: SDR family oxidoreductase [Hyphomicrobiales bacterium]|nr:SDR family oxidoreductase [Hyphomicrobiales bacterium]
MENTDFLGKTILVSGAGRGFGKHSAKCFFEQGANLVLTDFNEEMLEKALAPYSDHRDRVVGISGDIGLEDTSIKSVNLANETFGALDIAVNNAGIVHHQARLDTLDSKIAENVIQVDLLGVFYAMKHQLPLMMKRHQDTGAQCNIVNIASAAGIMGSPMLSAYAAAKHGVIGLTRSAALEYARKGIRVNAICPAFADTDMARNALQESHHGPEEAERRLVAGVPLNRLATVDEVVQAILWACSPRNSFCTGQALSIDGGLSSF